MTSHADWAVERSGEAPDALKARFRELFDEHPDWETLPRVEAFAQAAEFLTRRVLGSEPSRPVALDLLTADACVTFAFEAAADDPATLGARAAEMQARMAALVTRPA